jgi:hypothetical protein
MEYEPDNSDELLKSWSKCWLHCNDDTHRIIHYHSREALAASDGAYFGSVLYNNAVDNFKPFLYKAPLVDSPLKFVTVSSMCLR